mgnify:CR=1 FL=1
MYQKKEPFIAEVNRSLIKTTEKVNGYVENGKRIRKQLSSGSCGSMNRGSNPSIVYHYRGSVFCRLPVADGSQDGKSCLFTEQEFVNFSGGFDELNRSKSAYKFCLFRYALIWMGEPPPGLALLFPAKTDFVCTNCIYKGTYTGN